MVYGYVFYFERLSGYRRIRYALKAGMSLALDHCNARGHLISPLDHLFWKSTSLDLTHKLCTIISSHPDQTLNQLVNLSI